LDYIFAFLTAVVSIASENFTLKASKFIREYFTRPVPRATAEPGTWTLPHLAGTKIKGEENTGTKDKERRAYPKEFKAEAAAPAQKHEKPVRQVATD
jgi:hypothetical protein